MSTSPLVDMTAPLRGRFAVPYHDLGPRTAKPRAALVAGLHGDELNGPFVLARLASYLHSLEQGTQAGQALKERVVIVPFVNTLGLNARQRVWPSDGSDVNRRFPGRPEGETAGRIAHALLELTRGAYYRVDMHSSNADFEELAQVRLYAPSDDERASAFLFGLPAIVERPPNALSPSTLGHAWRRLGGESFVIQAGRAGQLDLSHCERLFHSLVMFLRTVGVLDGFQLSEGEQHVHHYGVHQTFPLISGSAGFFVSRLETGAWLSAGDVLGYVYDGFDGSLREEVKTPVSGLLSGLRRNPLLCEGDLLARIQTRQDCTHMVDTYLVGQGQ